MIAYYAALAFVLACALAFVFVNGAFDVGRFVTAVPVVAVVLLVLSIGVRVVFRRARTLAVRPNAHPIFRHDQRIGVALGAVGLAVGAFMTVASAIDMRSYQAAPSCQAGFAAAPGGRGPCRLVFGRITGVYTTGRRMARAMTLQLNDGSAHRAVVARNINGELWRAASRGTALDATAQLFGTRIVQVSTSAGQVQTTDFPQYRMFQWLIVGLVSGFFSLMYAIGMALRGLS